MNRKIDIKISILFLMLFNIIACSGKDKPSDYRKLVDLSKEYKKKALESYKEGN